MAPTLLGLADVSHERVAVYAPTIARLAAPEYAFLTHTGNSASRTSNDACRLFAGNHDGRCGC